MQEEDLKTQVTRKVEVILGRVFRGEKATVRIKHDRLNFACPFCGDSHDPKKKRANIYWDSMRFCCFNSGCSKPRTNLIGFLKHFNERLGNFESMEEVSDRIKTHRRTAPSVVGYSIFTSLIENAVPMETVTKRFGLVNPLKHSRASAYIKARRLHRLIGDTIRYSPAEDALYLLNSVNGGVVGFQVRPIKSIPGEPKYKSFNYEKVVKLVDVEQKLSAEDLERANTLSLFFGLLTADFTKDVTVLEGVIDSLFIGNSIAITGLSKDMSYFSDSQSVRFMLDNDCSGYDVAVELLKQGKSVFMWKKYLNDMGLDKEVKDVNELFIYCDKHGHKIRPLKGYFTTDELDLLYV